MSEPPDLLREFLRSMGTEQLASGTNADLLLEAMEPSAARLLRLSAIPHQFDEEILLILAPELEPSEVEKRCEEFSQLSFVSADGDCWALNDGVRRHLFSQWLSPQSAKQFLAASLRLATFFKKRAEQSRGEPAEIATRRSMFHLVGADQESGFREFERLLRRARHNRLHSESNQLVRLMHEYDKFLAPTYRAWLRYHESKLFADRGDLEAAEAGYQEVLNDPASPPELRTAAYVRTGYVHNERRNWDEALRSYNSALELATSARVPRILHDLGAAYRDKGDLERAEDLLKRSVELALKENNLSDQALAWNSLGTLALKRRDVSAAVQAFEKTLDALVRNNELFRTAQVYNNLGLAYCDVPDWTRGEEYFWKSLEITSKAGDTLGQAFALSNMARVQASRGDLKSAVASSTKAIDHFLKMRHRYDAALVKHNRGKLFVRMKEREFATKDFVEAIETLRTLGKPMEATAVAADLARLGARVGFPWWIWGAIGLFVFFVLLFALAVVLVEVM